MKKFIVSPALSEGLWTIVRYNKSSQAYEYYLPKDKAYSKKEEAETYLNSLEDCNEEIEVDNQ